MRLRDKETGEVGDYFLTNHKREKIAIVPNGKSPSEGIIFDSIKELNDRFENVPEEKTYGGRVPKNGDKYWYTSADGIILSSAWSCDGPFCPIDANRFELGSAFWTREEVEKELKRRKAYVILKEDTKGFKPDWEDSLKEKFYVYYDFNEKKLLIGFSYYCLGRLLHFDTEEDAEESIKTHQQQWLDYLGIEEEEV